MAWTDIFRRKARAQSDAPTADDIAPVSVGPRRRRKAKGYPGTQITQGFIVDDDHNPEVRGSKWYGSPGKPGIAHRMMRDPHVRQSVNYLADPLCSARWQFIAPTKDPLDREVADFCTWAFIECQPWRQLVRRMVRGYASNGFHFEEMTDDYRGLPLARFPSHPTGVGVVPTSFQHRPAETIYRFNQSKKRPDQLASIEQYTLGSDETDAGYTTVSADRLLRLTWDQDGGKFTGVPVLRSAYQPWKLKIAFITIDAIKHERTGVGVPLIELPDNPTDAEIDWAEEILAEMRANEKGFVILPNGYKFEWVGAGESNVSNIDAAIARCNIDIAMNVAAGFMLLSLGGSTGSNALAGTQQGAYHLTIDSHAAFLGDAFSLGCDGWSPVERIVRLNYGGGVSLPRLVARNLPTRDWLSITGVVNNAVVAGVLTADDPLEDQIRQTLDLGPRDESTARARPVSMGTPPAESSEQSTDETESTDE